MAIQITIGGVDFTSKIDLESIAVTNTVSNKSGTMEFEVTCVVGETIPRAGNEVIFLNGGTREFAGILMAPKEELINPAKLLYKCQARDYTYLFDRIIVPETYPSQAADVIVRAVVQNYTSGFTTTNVQNAFVVAEQQFNDLFPSDCVKTLADLLEFFWYIDYNRDVHFAPLEHFSSPLTGNTLYADTDTNTYHDLVLQEDISQLKNRIYLKNLKIKNSGSLPFKFTANGTQTWFPLGYEAYSADDVSVLVDGTPYTIKKEYVDGAPGDGQTSQAGYVCFDNMGIRITPTPANGANITGSVIPVNGPVKVMVDDPQAQAFMAAREGGNGVHEFVVNDPGLSGPDTLTAEARGQLLLLKYGYPKVTGTFGSYVQGWRAGQNFTLQSAVRMGGDFANGKKMYVTQVMKTIVNHPTGGAPTLRYQVSISDSPYTF